MAERRPEVMDEPYGLFVMTAQKTPSEGDQDTEFTVVFLAGKSVKPVQLTPSGLMAEYLYPPPDVLFTTAQNRPSCGDQAIEAHCCEANFFAGTAESANHVRPSKLMADL